MALHLFFYTDGVSKEPSPYYFSAWDIMKLSGYSKNWRVWTGTHEAPVLISDL